LTGQQPAELEPRARPDRVAGVRAVRRALRDRGERRLELHRPAQSAASGPAGLYDFPLREQSPTQSRWLSPDPGGAGVADSDNLQSLNRYSYVNNLPLNSTDFDGLVGPCPPGTAPATPAQAKAYSGERLLNRRLA